jgi:hypothetical protein
VEERFPGQAVQIKLLTMKKIWIKKGVMMVTFIIVATIVFSFLVMGLWNAILPEVIGVKPISFIQALGLLLLSKILFGGFHGRGFKGNGGPMWSRNMKEKWNAMTPEEREKFKSEWKNRCGGRWKMKPEQSITKDINPESA